MWNFVKQFLHNLIPHFTQNLTGLDREPSNRRCLWTFRRPILWLFCHNEHHQHQLLSLRGNWKGDLLKLFFLFTTWDSHRNSSSKIFEHHGNTSILFLGTHFYCKRSELDQFLSLLLHSNNLFHLEEYGNQKILKTLWISLSPL